LRQVLGILEALLAVAFIATAVVQLLRGKFGLTDMATALLLIAVGLWLAKVAVGNFKSKPPSTKY